jgi:hypothetical protein
MQKFAYLLAHRAPDDTRRSRTFSRRLLENAIECQRRVRATRGGSRSGEVATAVQLGDDAVLAHRMQAVENSRLKKCKSWGDSKNYGRLRQILTF